jgi:hypothetical protein
MAANLKRYSAMIWTSDDEPGERVCVDAKDLDEAHKKLRGSAGPSVYGAA